MCDYEIRNANDKELWLRIKALEERIDKLGAVGCKGFDWIEWDSLIEDMAALSAQLSLHKVIVKRVLSRYD